MKLNSGDAAFVLHDITMVPNTMENRANAYLHLVIVKGFHSVDKNRIHGCRELYEVVAARVNDLGHAEAIKGEQPFVVYENQIIGLDCNRDDPQMNNIKLDTLVRANELANQRLPKYKSTVMARRVHAGLNKEGGKGL